MSYILWLYIFFSNLPDCRYERVGIFTTADSLYIISTTLNYHLKYERETNQFEVYSSGDDLFAVQVVVSNSGIIIFVSDIKKKTTLVLSNNPCN